MSAIRGFGKCRVCGDELDLVIQPRGRMDLSIRDKYCESCAVMYLEVLSSALSNKKTSGTAHTTIEIHKKYD